MFPFGILAAAASPKCGTCLSQATLIPHILLAVAVSTRDALIVRPQSLLIFERHRPAIALAQITHRILLRRTLLQFPGSQTQAAKRIVQLALAGLTGRILALRRILSLLPAFNKPSQIFLRPAKL